MRFLADHNLIEQVSVFFEARQHEVLRVRDAVGAASPDFVVAQVALNENRILLTQDRDFRTQQRRNRAHRQVMESVHLVHICDLGPDTLRRVAEIIDIIEREAEHRLAAGERVQVYVEDRRVIIQR